MRRMHICRPVLVLGVFMSFLSVHVPANAMSHVIDAEQSYVTFDFPAWEQGEYYSYVELDEDGLEVSRLEGYLWHHVYVEHRFSISGTLEIAVHPYGYGSTMMIDSSQMQIDLPVGLAFAIPDYMSLDRDSGFYISSIPCDGTSTGGVTFCQANLHLDTVKALLAGSTMTMEGRSNLFPHSIGYIEFEGLEAPPVPGFDQPDYFSYRYHIVTSVPEPVSGSMLLAGLIVAGWRARRAHGS